MVKKQWSKHAEFRGEITEPRYRQGGHCPGKADWRLLTKAFVSSFPHRRGEGAAPPDTGLQFQSSEGYFKKSRLFRGPEKGSGENVSEAEIYQQNRPKETCHQLGTEGITGTKEPDAVAAPDSEGVR